MSIKDLVKRNNAAPVRRTAGEGIFSFQNEMNRLFDDFFKGFDLQPFAEHDSGMQAFTPKVDISENEKEIAVSADLPGMDEKDVSVEIADDLLTIRGEKKDEHEEKGRNWHRIERSSGSFVRTIPLPCEVDDGKAKATFKKGVLKIAIPKVEQAVAKRKTITVTAE